jgi:hypothetical protein
VSVRDTLAEESVMSRFEAVRGVTGLAFGIGIVLVSLASPRLRAGGPAGCGIEGPAADPPTFKNCAGCHLPTGVNSGDGAFRFEGLPSAWTPGTTYRVAGVLSDPGQSLWGFHATIVGEDGLNAGTLAPADANTRLCTVDGRCYLSQVGAGRFPGVVDGPVRWEFDWTAPPAGAGAIVAYGVGIACNFDGEEDGDFTYTTTSASVEAGATGTGVTVVLQPHAVVIAPGGDLVVRVRVTNHDAAPRTVFLATRAVLPSGRPFPRTGFLHEPIRLDLAAGGEAIRTFTHHVRATAQATSAEYRAFVGAARGVQLASDAVTVTVENP